MENKQLHKHVKAVYQAVENLLKAVEKEMVDEEENARVAGEHAAAVEQARREIQAENEAAAKNAGVTK